MFTLSGGSVFSTTTLLPGGTHTLTARYAGDATFAASTSAPSSSVSVSAEPSITTLSAFTLDSKQHFVPFASLPYGSFVYLLATVKGQSGQGAPTGMVDMWDNNGPFGLPFSLNSQGIAATPNFLNSAPGGTPVGYFDFFVGQHSVTAMYDHTDQSFLQSSSSPVNFTITQAPITVSVSAAGNSQGATLLATINSHSGGSSPFRGTVTFYINGKQVGDPIPPAFNPAIVSPTGTLIGQSGFANYTDTGLANGSYNLKATYNGDQDFLPTSSPTVEIKVQPNFEFYAGETEVDIAKAGDSGTLDFTIIPDDGFKGTINLSSASCTGLPAGASCSFSPSSITGGGNPILTITTSAAASGTLLRHDQQRWAWWMASSGIGLPGFFLIGARRKRRTLSMLSSVAVFALLVLIAGCGGGGGGSASTAPSGPPTPSGSYTVTVRANSGSLSHKVTFTLNVG